jgi:hypothetical protein
MPRSRIYCKKCKQASLVWVGLGDTRPECPKCHQPITVPKLSTSMRSQYDSLIDDYPNISGQIKKLEEKLTRQTLQFHRKKQLLLDEIKIQIERESSLLKSIKQSWAQRQHGMIRISYMNREIYVGQSTQQALSAILNKKLESNFIQMSKGGFAVSKVEKDLLKQMRAIFDRIEKLKEKRSSLDVRELMPTSLRSLHFQILDSQEELNRLLDVQSNIKRIEKVLQSSTASSKNPVPKKSHPARSHLSIDWREAERIARDYLRSIGIHDARLTPSGRDGGVDITSKTAIAQVKWHVAQVGSPDLQSLFGIATYEKKLAIFFAQRYSPDALRWAKKTDMALFRFTASGKIQPVSPKAEQIS